MKKSTFAKLFGAAVGCVAASQAANAAVMIDVDGPAGANAAVAVESFDFLPGNSLNVGALVPTANSFKNLFQARLGAVLDQNGNVILLNGLNSPTGFEITVVAEFDLAVTGYAADPVLTTTTTAILPNSGVNSVKFFYDDTPDADDLNGTGFTDGVQILDAKASFGGSSFVEFNWLADVQYDQFGANDYPGIKTKTGVGGLTLDADVNSTNAGFFVDPIEVASINASTTNVFPFKQINPSKLFTSAGGPVAPQIGAINGVSGPDIQIQTDATVSFRPVPEPGTLMALGLGTMGLMLRRRRA